MSIEIDWEVTDAPTGDDDSGFSQRSPSRAPSLVGGPAPEPAAPGARRRRFWLAVPLVFAVGAGLGLNYVTRLGWQPISDEVVALVRYEEQLATEGEVLLLLRVQDYSNSQWLAVRGNQVAANQPAPLPVPVLAPEPGTSEIGPLEMVDTNLVRADVYRKYQAPDGQLVTFALPQFYRRQGRNEDWARTAVPDSYWGGWHDWQSPHLFVRHSERDRSLVEKIGPRLEALLGEACQLWGQAYCVNLPPAKLFLSGYVGSLEYDPLANVRVRVEFGDPAGGESLPADYFVSVPSPQLAGQPADAATEQFLTEYLAVRLIASQAAMATATRLEAGALTTEAVIRLGLDNADPGFASASRPLRGEDGLLYALFVHPDSEAVAAAPAPVAGATLITRLKPPVALVTYEVQPGDTLLGIATFFAVPVETIARLNGIENPDFIQVGTRLLIPPGDEE